MMNRLFILLIGIAFVSCENKVEDVSEGLKVTKDDVEKTMIIDALTNPLVVVRNFNAKDLQWEIEYYRISNDTLYTFILPKDLEKNLQAPLSKEWFMELNISLSHIEELRYVNIEVQVVNHASSGVYELIGK